MSSSVSSLRSKLSSKARKLFDKFINNLSVESSTVRAKVIQDSFRMFERMHPVPSFKLIDIMRLASFQQFPRYRDVTGLLINLDDLDKKKSFIVFISHLWSRGDSMKVFNSSVVPDNETNDKLRICVEGILKIKELCAPHKSDCFVWIDCSCIDDSGEILEFENYDRIIEHCDCIFTPIVDALSRRQDDLVVENLQLYLDSAWCRMEMVYGAIVPILCSSLQVSMFSDHNSRVRPHFYMAQGKDFTDLQLLSPIHTKYFTSNHPLKGDTYSVLEMASVARSMHNLLDHLQAVQVLPVSPECVNDLQKWGPEFPIRELATGLSDAINRSDYQLIEYFLSIGLEYDFTGGHVLVEATRIQSLEIVKFVLQQQRVSVNSISFDGSTALILATKLGQAQAVQILIRNNADVNLIDDEGHPALYYAKRGGFNEIVSILLSAIGDMSGEFIVDGSASDARGPNLQLRCTSAVSVVTANSIPNSWTVDDFESYSYYDRVEIADLQTVLTNYLNDPSESKLGKLLSFFFKTCNTCSMVSQLPDCFLSALVVVSGSAVVNNRDSSTLNCIIHALTHLEHLEALKLLLSNSEVRIDIGDERLCTALIIVCKSHQNKQIAAFLLEKGANIRAVNEDSLTAIQYVVDNELRELLLSYYPSHG